MQKVNLWRLAIMVAICLALAVAGFICNNKMSGKKKSSTESKSIQPAAVKLSSAAVKPPSAAVKPTSLGGVVKVAVGLRVRGKVYQLLVDPAGKNDGADG